MTIAANVSIKMADVKNSAHVISCFRFRATRTAVMKSRQPALFRLIDKSNWTQEKTAC